MIDGLAGAAADALKNASDAADYIQYWRNFKGKEVDIRAVTISKENAKSGNQAFIIYTIRGTVSEVSGLPPGFILEDVEERVEERRVSTFQPASSTSGIPKEATEVAMSPRRVDEKFVSFSSIEELELTEVREGADTELLDLNEDGGS